MLTPSGLLLHELPHPLPVLRLSSLGSPSSKLKTWVWSGNYLKSTQLLLLWPWTQTFPMHFLPQRKHCWDFYTASLQLFRNHKTLGLKSKSTYPCRLLFGQYLTPNGLPFPCCLGLVTSHLHMPRKALLTSKHYSRKIPFNSRYFTDLD